MGFFSKRQRSAVDLAGLPAGFDRLVAQLGRQSILGPGFPSLPGDLVVTLWNLSEQDRPLFYRALNEAAESHGGWGWVGASWVVKDVGPSGYLKDEAHDVIMEAATSFLRQQRTALGALAPIHQQWWSSRHAGESW